MKFLTTILVIIFISASAFFIQKEQSLPHLIKFEIPEGWSKPNNIFANNPLTEEGFQLGRKLFYDGRLSKDGNFSCASCHQQFAAFATYDHDFSHGFNNQFSTRNAPALQNLAWVPLFHWDGGINHIELQALSPLTAPNEMAENIDSVLIKLRKNIEYRKMFNSAFGSEMINSQHMLKALAQFTGYLVSANSKYDKFKKDQEKFNPSELHGYEVFKEKCANLS